MKRWLARVPEKDNKEAYVQLFREVRKLGM
jgi:hypothetical protein